MELILEGVTSEEELKAFEIPEKQMIAQNRKVKRIGDLTYYIQFKNKAGNWGEPVFIDSLASDSTIRTAKELELQHTLGIRKLGKGDYDIAKFTIAANNGYYFGSSSNCKVMLYQDNKHLSTFSPEQMVSNNSTLLAPATYFAIIIYEIIRSMGTLF